MKKTFLLLIVALALGTVGCGNGTIAKKQEEILKMSDAEIRQKLADNNDHGKIVAGGEYCVSETSRINNQGTYKWVVSDQFFYFSKDGAETVYDHGEEYGMFDGSTFYRVRVFDDELQEYEYEDLSGMTFTKYQLLDSERGVLLEKDGENMRYETLLSIADKGGDEFLESYGIDSKKYQELKAVCIFETDTFRIINFEKYLVDENGEELLITTEKDQYLSENPVKEEVAALHEKCYGGENYKIRIIVGQGTDREKVYETTINKDVCLDLWVRDADGGYTVYTDPELTNEYLYDENDMLKFSADTTLYMK